jgi:hypothetical protein
MKFRIEDFYENVAEIQILLKFGENTYFTRRPKCWWQHEIAIKVLSLSEVVSGC